MWNEWKPQYDANGKCTNQLYDFDANGLYATVMRDAAIKFPDLSSFWLIS